MARCQLDKLVCNCGVPGCEDPMFLHSQCHPSGRLWVSYFDGVLTVTCGECDAIVTKIQVAAHVGPEGP